ncbi:MAG: hybrid sensor histidine kinase/response regulator [Anaerolineae bacterium]
MVDRRLEESGDVAIYANMEDLSRTLVRYLAVTLAAGSVIWVVVAIRVPTLVLLAGIVCLLIVAGVAHSLSARTVRGAAWLLSIGSGIGIATISQVPELEAGLYFLALPAIVIAFSAGAVPGVAMTVAAAGAAAYLGRQSPAMPSEVLLILAVGICSALVAYTARAQLTWAWRRSQDADGLAEQLRDRQGKLHRTMKTLELTNHLLQRTNRELELSRREAEEARRMKAEFAAGISHELRTPLNIILGFTEIMSRSPEVYGDMRWPMTLRRDVSEIRRNAVYLSEFVDDVLDLARIDALRMPIRREPTRLEEVVGEAVEVVRRLVQSKPVQLSVRMPETLPTLQIDRTRVRQVLLNLLTNACRFTDEGEIAVSAQWNDGQVVVDVADTGSGIPEDALERIFDAFEQVHQWDRPGERGKGLGLAVAKQLVLLHGGRIWARSAPGRGSTFSFSLPVTPIAVSRLGWTGDSVLPADQAARRVLVLDEEDLAATYLHRHFEGYSFSHVRDATEAATATAELHPAAMVVNLSPEDDTPIGGLRQLAGSPGTPVIGCSLPGRRWLRQDERFAATLTKPVSAELLLATVHRLAPTGPVLVVDDDRGFVQFVRRAFQTAGEMARLCTAYDGPEALEVARQRHPALALVDLVMPDMDGFALTDALAADEALSSMPIVAISGASPGEEALSTRGDVLVVCKPMGFRGKELADLLRAVLATVSADYVTRSGSAAERIAAGTETPAS